MLRHLLLALILTVPFVARADEATTQPTVVQAIDKDALTTAMAEKATTTVEGTVATAAWSKSGKVMNIEFDGADNSRFLAVLFVRNRAAFDQAFDGDVAAALPGKTVRLTGRIEEYAGKVDADKGRPQMILNKPQQLVIVTDTPE